MLPNRTLRTSLAGGLALFVLAAAAGCAASNDDGASTGEARTGGVLKIVGTSSVDHINPTTAGNIASNNVQHAISRTLINYQSSMDEETRIQPQGDLATEVPEPTDDGLTYTYTIREGATFDTPDGGRQIESSDVARGIELMCSPFQSSPRLPYLLPLVDGMAEYCDGFSAVAPEPAAMKEYVESNEISGIDTTDPAVIVFHLTKKASDFNYMLSLPPTAPQPVESLDYVPDSPEFRENFMATGPYTVGEFVPDESLQLVRNPSWNADSDPLRKAYVDEIDFTFGVTADATMQQLQSGDADLSFGGTIPTATLQQLQAVEDPGLVSFDAGRNEFIWMNTRSDNNNGALRDLRVRQAVAYAIDKKAIVQTLGGPEVASVQQGIFGPGVAGYHEFEPFPSEDSAGDPEKSKELLAEAGFPDGITLKMPYMTVDPEPARAQTVQASLAKAGITIELVPVSASDYYSKFMVNRDTTAAGIWDIAPGSWQPDWVGGAARSVFQAQYSMPGPPQTYNYADLNDPVANDYAEQALSTTDPEESASFWEKVDEQIMSNAVVIPTDSPKVILYHAPSVQNFVVYPLGAQADWTNIWLDK